MAMVPSDKIFMSSIAVYLTFRIDLSIFFVSIHLPRTVCFLVENIVQENVCFFNGHKEWGEFPTHSDGVTHFFTAPGAESNGGTAWIRR